MKIEKNKQALVSIFVIMFLAVCFSGCTSNQNTSDENLLSGIWVGNLEMPSFGRNTTTSVSEITFSGNTVEMTLNTAQGTYTTNYTYSINGATLVLTPQFNGRGTFPGRQPYNGTQPGNWTRPQNNGTWSNGTFPGNGTRPGNWTNPGNRTGFPGGGQPRMSVSFTYNLNDDHTILYLNGAEFRKTQ
jgi:hypothetical protein